MALFTVHRYHRVECCPASKTEFLRVFNSLWQLFIAVQQQIASDFRALGSHIKRQAISLSIPIGTTTVLFPRKTLRSYVQMGILALIRLVKLKDIKPDTLLCFLITFNHNIRCLPYRRPIFFLHLQ